MIHSHLGNTLALAKYIMLTILAENMFCNCRGLLVHHLLSIYCQSLLIVSLFCYLKWLTIYLKNVCPFCLFFISTRVIKVLLTNANYQAVSTFSWFRITKLVTHKNTWLPHLWKNLPQKSLVNSETAQSYLLPRSKGPPKQYCSLIFLFSSACHCTRKMVCGTLSADC